MYCEPVDVKVYKDSGTWYVDVLYEYTDTHENKHEIEVTGVHLPLYSHPQTVYSDRLDKAIDIGYGDVYLIGNIVDTITEYATKEMTLEQIEKELGYKVKVITNKEEK